MKISYFPTPYPEAEIAATPTEFAALAERIGELARAGRGEIRVAASEPGLPIIRIHIETGPVLVAVRDDVLSVSGSAESVELFGQILPEHDSLPPNYHIHFEHST